MDYNHQPLFMIRPTKASKITVKAIAAQLGHEPNVVYCPIVDIKTYDTPVPKDAQQPFVFTSINAVEIVQTQTPQRGVAICVGQKTAQAASVAGFDVMETFETAQKMISHGLPPKFTYFQGLQTSVDLKPYGAVSHVLYEQIPVQLSQTVIAKMKLGGIIPIYSEYAAIRLIEELGGEHTQAVAICISENVAKHLDSLMFERILIARLPTSGAMLDRMVNEF